MLMILKQRKPMHENEQSYFPAYLLTQRPKIHYLQQYHQPANHEYRFIGECWCGFKWDLRLSEATLMLLGEFRFYETVFWEIDKHLCGSDLEKPMDIFYTNILAQVNQALIKELVDDTMLRFSLLELK